MFLYFTLILHLKICNLDFVVVLKTTSLQNILHHFAPMASLQKEKRTRARVEGMYVFTPRQTFGRSRVQRITEVDCLCRRYNRHESDFPSRFAYDDFLEEREDISKHYMTLQSLLCNLHVYRMIVDLECVSCSIQPDRG